MRLIFFILKTTFYRTGACAFVTLTVSKTNYFWIMPKKGREKWHWRCWSIICWQVCKKNLHHMWLWVAIPILTIWSRVEFFDWIYVIFVRPGYKRNYVFGERAIGLYYMRLCIAKLICINENEWGKLKYETKVVATSSDAQCLKVVNHS